jgi:DNA repair protein SbcC/Rad50
MMLVRSLSLKNIRSYNGGEETRLDLPEGVVLFEGDVGSGKSTILYALEFALFGLSDMKGAYLLSEGRNEGKVSVTFESSEKEYTVVRRLRAKGDEVVQDECYISNGGERVRLSPSDLKERVVSILGFNEPTHPRAESLVYRYAVFTPQEQMKEILAQNSEERLHVIRRVLGAQSYQVAAENSELVERKVREISHGLKKASEDLEEKKDEADEKSRAIAQLEADIPELQEKEAASSRLVRNLEAEWKDSLGQREGLSKSAGKIPLLQEESVNLQESISEDEERLHAFEVRLRDEIDPVVRHFEGMPKPTSGARDAESFLSSEKEKLIQLRDTKRNLGDELTKVRDLISRGFCPLCGQRIPGDLGARTEHTEHELSGLEEQIRQVEASVAALGMQLASARVFEEAAKDYSRATRDKGMVEAEVRALRKRLQHSAMRLAKLRSELEEAASEAKEVKELTLRIADLESRLKRARQDDKQASLELSRAKTELADAANELRRLAAEVKQKENTLEEARRLTSYQAWLSSFFRPTVELIEKQTLALASARFNEHFQRFFTSLVDDPDMVVRVTEDFSPLFEREGFEQDYEALSGGERTSMALAYRFALNSVVNESVASRPELVILDEPTDGFSKDQVFRMRGLLDALDSRQVILVSHEKELESMADHIFHVEKKNGTSVVLGVQA